MNKWTDPFFVFFFLKIVKKEPKRNRERDWNQCWTKEKKASTIFVRVFVSMLSNAWQHKIFSVWMTQSINIKKKKRRNTACRCFFSILYVEHSENHRNWVFFKRIFKLAGNEIFSWALTFHLKKGKQIWRKIWLKYYRLTVWRTAFVNDKNAVMWYYCWFRSSLDFIAFEDFFNPMCILRINANRKTITTTTNFIVESYFIF